MQNFTGAVLARVAFALMLTAGFALFVAPAAQATHSITVSSSAGGVVKDDLGGYLVTFNTQASSTEPCRNWGDAADAQVQPPGGGTFSAAPVDRTNTADPGNANQSAVNFSWTYEAPAGSRVTFASRVGCDTTNHIGGEGLGAPVEVSTPNELIVYCTDEPRGRIDSYDVRGSDLGYNGTQLFDGQEIRGSTAGITTVVFGDGSRVQLSKKDRFFVVCPFDGSFDDKMEFHVDVIEKTNIRTAPQGGEFNVETPRAVIEHRGTEFSVEYDKKQQRTTVKVKSGKVVVRALKGSKKKIVAGKGETVIQVGKKAPEIVKK